MAIQKRSEGERRRLILRQANESLMREIEEHKLTGKTLLKARDSLAEAQRVAHLGNWDWDTVSNDLQWSDEIFRIFGLSPQEFGATYEAFLRSVHPEDRELVNEAVNSALERKEPYSIDHRIVLPDGTERIVHEQAEVTFDETGRPVRMLGTVQDITDRKRTEEALQRSERELRLLSSRLLSAQESERKRIARELHDGIGQTLSAIKFSLENTLANLKDEITAAGREGLERLIPMMQKAIEEVRKTSQGLRPSILDDLGLLTTIAWFCREFHAIYSAIEVRQQIELEEAHVPGDLKIVLFRILQESMNNAAKHSGADLVRIGLKEATSGGIELSVEDNGCGFEPGSVFLSDGTGRGLGLASMRERAELSGGSFWIESIPGEGTLVRACWPADPG
jgi:PAS domain S-box-containing protein